MLKISSFVNLKTSFVAKCFKSQQCSCSCNQIMYIICENVSCSEQKALLEKLQQQEKDKITKFRVEVSRFFYVFLVYRYFTYF